MDGLTAARSAITVALVAAALGGCAAKAKPAAPAGFVDATVMDQNPLLPFHKAWVKPGVDWNRYTKLHVAPVNTAYMLQMTDWQKGARGTVGGIEKDVQELAVYTRRAIEEAFRKDPKKRFRVVEKPTEDPDVLLLEVALTEVVPSKVTLNALGYAPFGIGVGLKAVRAVAEDQSTVAIEARGRDAATNATLLTFADREAEQQAIVSVRGLTWYSHAHAMIDSWAGQFVQMADGPGTLVQDSSAFTLEPW